MEPSVMRSAVILICPISPTSVAGAKKVDIGPVCEGIVVIAY